MELKPAIEIALAVMNEDSPARIEGLIRARDREMIERCIDFFDRSESCLWTVGEIITALEKLKEEI